MTTFQAYTRSFIIAIISFILYLFAALALLGVYVDEWDALRLRYALLILLAIPVIAFVAAQFTAKRKLYISVTADTLIIKRLSRLSLVPFTDRTIHFSEIKEFKYKVRIFRSDAIRIKLYDGTSLQLLEQPLPLVKVQHFSDLASDLSAHYDTLTTTAVPLAAPLADVAPVRPVTRRPLAAAGLPFDPDKKVTLRRSGMFFFSILISLVFFNGFMGALLMVMAIDEGIGQNVGLFTAGIAISLFGLYSVYRYFLNAPAVMVDKDKIVFSGGKMYAWSDVKQLRPGGKRPFKYLLTFPMEGMMFKFRDGTVRYLFNSMYTNLWELKSFARQIRPGSSNIANAPISYAPIDTVPYREVAAAHFTSFKGNPFTSFRGISIWLPLLIGGLFSILAPDIAIGFIVVGVLFLCIFPFTMNYFQVSQDYLVIRNHVFLWKRKVYALDDIQEVLLDAEGKQANKLTIIFNNFQTKAFQAGTLRDRNWWALKTALGTAGIKVRDEIGVKAEDTKGEKKTTWLLYVLLTLYLLIYAIGYVVVADYAWYPVIKLVAGVLGFVAMLAAMFFTVTRLGAVADKIDKAGSE